LPVTRLLGPILAALLALCTAPALAEESGFAGSATCAGCHEAETAAWTGSDHAWALKTPDSTSVLGDFNDVRLTGKGITSRFFRQGADYMVETDGPDGALTQYPVRYVVGVHPLQQYLVEADGGRLQVLDLAWDTEQQRWFDLYPDQQTAAGNGMHWSGTYKNWQARCAECHQTGFDKGFDPDSKTYQTHWAELTVGCESCHGPAADHVKQAKTAQAAGSTDPLPALLPLGPGHQGAEFAICGNCHSRRSAFSQASAPVGGVFGDHYKLSPLTPDLYFADGQQRDEVYILGSFLQSKMAAKGVTCSNCHDAHSGALVAEGNTVCTQCHSEAGRSEFPSLSRKDYDSPAHTHHAAGSQASDCVSCHMPERTYMQIDPRRDHFMRRPDPLQSSAAGAPDACTTCHADQTPAWAAAQIAAWAPGSDYAWQDRAPFIAFTSGDQSPEVLQALADYALDTGRPAIVRATALQLLGDTDAPGLKDSLSALTKDPSDLVRAAAVGLLRQSDPLARYLRLSPLLSDPVRSVRDAASGELAYFDQPQNADRDLTALKAGLAEYLAARNAFADTPESQMAMAGLNLSLRNWDAAIAAFTEAAALDPQLEQPWVMLIRIKSALQDPQGAEQILAEALAALPDNAALWTQSANLALTRGDAKTAISSLQKVVGLQPGDLDAWLQMSSIAVQTGDAALAVWAGDSAVQIAPKQADAWLASAIGHYVSGDLPEAKRRSQRAKDLDPALQIPLELEVLLRR
jgi:predicted CXXCH cytochrome family protein